MGLTLPPQRCSRQILQPLSTGLNLYLSESKLLQYFGSTYSTISNGFPEFVKVKNHTVRCRAHLIISECYSLDLPRSLSWRTILNYEMLRLPDTLRVLLVRFADVVKVTNNIGLWDAELAWYSPNATHWICRCRKGDELQWTVRYQAHLILSVCNSIDLQRSWKWPSTLNCEIPSSPDTLEVLFARFDEVVKVTNHIGVWNTELAWYSASALHRICIYFETSYIYIYIYIYNGVSCWYRHYESPTI